MAKAQNMLPEDTGDDAPVDFGEIRVDFSSEEAASEGKSFDPIPTGKYHVAVYDCKLEKCGPSSKNPGKPMWNMQLKIQDGEYADRVVFTRIMLFEGALYSLAQFEKAFRGIEIKAQKGYKVPSPQEIIGLEGTAIVRKQVDKYAIDNGEWDGNGPKPMKNEVKGFQPVDAAKASAGSASLMP